MSREFWKFSVNLSHGTTRSTRKWFQLINLMSRWAVAGRYRDILSELASAGHMDLPTMLDLNARGSEGQSITQDEVVHPPFASLPGPSSHPIAEGRAPAGIPHSEQPSTASDQAQASINSLQTTPSPTLNFTLPMYGTELSQLPIYGHFGFLDSVATTETPTSPSVALPQVVNPLDEFHLFLANLAAGPPSARGLADQGMVQGVPVAGSLAHTQGQAQAQDIDAYLSTLYQNSQAFLGNLFSTTFSAQRSPTDSSDVSVPPSPPAASSGAPIYTGPPFVDVQSSPINFNMTNQFNEQFKFGNGDVAMEAMDTDMMTMWSTAPTGFE